MSPTARSLALHGRAAADDESTGVQLLADIQAMFLATSDDMIGSEEIVKKLVEMAERPWTEFGKGRGLSQNSLARVLKGFEVRPCTIRIEGKTPRCYRRVDLADAFLRYLPQQPKQPKQDENDRLSDPVANQNTPPTVSLAQTNEKDRSDVAGRRRMTGPVGVVCQRVALVTARPAAVGVRELAGSVAGKGIGAPPRRPSAPTGSLPGTNGGRHLEAFAEIGEGRGVTGLPAGMVRSFTRSPAGGGSALLVRAANRFVGGRS
jgi:hypothetical protein